MPEAKHKQHVPQMVGSQAQALPLCCGGSPHIVILSGLGSGQLSRPVKKARKGRKATPGLLDTWLLGPLLGLRFRLWTLAHTLGWTTHQPGLAGTVESCLGLEVQQVSWTSSLHAGARSSS